MNWLLVPGGVVALLLLLAWAFDRWRARLPPERRQEDMTHLIQQRRRELRSRSPVRRFLRDRTGDFGNRRHPPC